MQNQHLNIDSNYEFSTTQYQFLKSIAPRFVWWKTPEEALLFPSILISKIMNRGKLEDVIATLNLFSNDFLKNLLNNTEFGEFSPEAWHFWHYYLYKLELGQVPPLPKRFTNENSKNSP